MTNEHVLKLGGKANIPEPLEIGHNYTIHIQGSVTSKTETDSQGEEHIFYYKFDPVLVEVITPTGKTIKAKDLRQRSQQMRAVITREWREDQTSTQTAEEYYDERMKELIGTLIEKKI